MTGPEDEAHPSFGWAQVNRVTSTGTYLFDSEVRHREYVVLRIATATRRRELNRDWIHPSSLLSGEIVEVEMSMAQWGALVSSFGSSGVPVTIARREGQRIEDVPHDPRLAHSVAEVEGSVDRLMERVRERTSALTEAFERKAGRREMAELLRGLEGALNNAVPNARYAANTFTEHVENVVTKARYDIEASVHRAAAAGLSVGDAVAGLLDSPEAES